MPDHYFSENPNSPVVVRDISFEANNKEFRATIESGVFSSARLDPGTRVLLDFFQKTRLDADLPEPETLLDLGCGWGPISLVLGDAFPQSQVFSVDINRRALDITARNLRLNNISNVTPATPDQVSSEIQFDEIWSNPPIRIGKTNLHDLLRTWLAKLSPTGKAYLVVAKQLGAPSLLDWLNAELGYESRKVSQDKGFWVLEVSHPAK